jgi:hypothetical protein
MTYHLDNLRLHVLASGDSLTRKRHGIKGHESNESILYLSGNSVAWYIHMKRELQAFWRRNKSRIVGSPCATLDQVQSYSGLGALWGPVLLFLAPLTTISILLNVSFQRNGEMPRVREWIHDEWTRSERQIWGKIEDNEAPDRDQDNSINN